MLNVGLGIKMDVFDCHDLVRVLQRDHALVCGLYGIFGRAAFR